MLRINNLKLDNNSIKICVPIAKVKKNDILDLSHKMDNRDIDIVELRLDYYEDVLDIVKTMDLISKVRENIDKVLLITFRTVAEGGYTDVTLDHYAKIYEEIIKNKYADMIDLEYRLNKKITDRINALAKEKDIKVIYSYHDFNQTPKYERLIHYFNDMSTRGADIVKIAAMATNESDVEELKKAARESSISRPTVAISMGEMGVDTRINAKDIGSCFTFASFDGTSAPGQVDISKIKR